MGRENQIKKSNKKSNKNNKNNNMEGTPPLRGVPYPTL
jgi:hypothetical protein